MRFWIVTVENPQEFAQVDIAGAPIFYTNKVPNGTLFVFQERDVPFAAKSLANNHPGLDVHVLEQTEAYYVKPSAPIRKVWDKTTGDLRVL